jgi:hypothetical protein
MDRTGKQNEGSGKESAGFTFHFTTDDSGVVKELAVERRYARMRDRPFRVSKHVACPNCSRRFATRSARDDHVAINHTFTPQ